MSFPIRLSLGLGLRQSLVPITYNLRIKEIPNSTVSSKPYFRDFVKLYLLRLTQIAGGADLMTPCAQPMPGRLLHDPLPFQ